MQLPSSGASSGLVRIATRERGQETSDVHERLQEDWADGPWSWLATRAHHVCGFIAVADRMRPQARAAMEALRAAGVEYIVMLTGDNRGTGEARPQRGVDELRAELLPDDKVTAVEELVAHYSQVAMVGDG